MRGKQTGTSRRPTTAGPSPAPAGRLPRARTPPDAPHRDTGPHGTTHARHPSTGPCRTRHARHHSTGRMPRAPHRCTGPRDTPDTPHISTGSCETPHTPHIGTGDPRTAAPGRAADPCHGAAAYVTARSALRPPGRHGLPVRDGSRCPGRPAMSASRAAAPAQAPTRRPARSARCLRPKDADLGKVAGTGFGPVGRRGLRWTVGDDRYGEPADRRTWLCERRG